MKAAVEVGEADKRWESRGSDVTHFHRCPSALVQTSRVPAEVPRPELVLHSPSYRSTMKVVSTFHHPSAVTCSAKCKFVPDNREYLVIGKTNRLELYSLQPKGIHLESTLDVWGHVVAVRPVEFSVSAAYGISRGTSRSTLTVESRIGPDRDKTSPSHRPPLPEADIAIVRGLQGWHAYITGGRLEESPRSRRSSIRRINRCYRKR